MLYSVLMSVYNKEQPQFLRESLDSIATQTVKTNDFVLICDGTLTQELNDVIADFGEIFGDVFNVVRLEKNSGLGVALNIGVSICKNELIVRMDSDDIAFPDRCERQLAVYSETNADIIGGAVLEFEVTTENVLGSRIPPQTQAEILRFAKRRNPFNHPSVMFCKKAVLAAGGYQPFYLCEDYYLWVRMLQNGATGYNIQETLLYMRSGSSMYKRRAGWKYLKTMLNFRWQLKTMGFSSWNDFFISGVGQIISCLLPNKCRQCLYRVVLRK